MANNWDTFSLGKFYPPELRETLAGFESLIGILNADLQFRKQILEIVAALAAAAFANPIEATLRAAIAEIEALIDGLTKDTKAHAILIPIQKQFYGLGERTPGDQITSHDYTPSFDGMLDENAFAARALSDIDGTSISFINDSDTAVGGNQGFWKTLYLSILDEGDPARPQFPNTFAVTGTCVIFGARSLAALQPHFSALEALLNLGGRASLSANTAPTIDNIHVKAVPLSTEGRIGVQIDWDPVPPVISFPLYAEDQLVAREIFVIRSIDKQFRENFAWKDVFPEQPSTDPEILPINGPTKVIARITNDGFIKRYVDTDPDLTAGAIYYYALAIRYEIDGVSMPMGPLSAVRRLEYTGRPQTTRLSELPDWWATPSLIQLFPDLEGLINKVRLAIASLGSRTRSNSGLSSMVAQTIRQIEALLEQNEAILEELSRLSDSLNALANTDLGGISATTFTVTTGGIDGWMGELATRLSDQTDPTRPPFDNAELVSGFVIVNGAPSVTSLETLKSLLELFFGSSEDNALLDALATIDVEIGASTTIELDAGLAATRALTHTHTEPTKIVFDDTMNPVETIECE